MTAGAAGRLPGGRRQPTELRRAVVPRRRAAAAVAPAQRGARARRGRRGARRRLRQRQPRPDDVAARAARQRLARVGRRRRSRSRPSTCRCTCSRCIPNAPLKDEMARARWSQAPDDDAAAMYLDGDGAARGRRATAVRDFERRAPRPSIAPQPEILDRRRVARVRLRRPLDARTASVGRMSPPPRSTSSASAVGRRPRSTCAACRPTSGSATRCSPACGWLTEST